MAPENTLAAFRLGAQHGFKAFECDVKISADGVAFLLHDTELDRTTGEPGIAEEKTWAELARLDAGEQARRKACGHELAERPVAVVEHAVERGRRRRRRRSRSHSAPATASGGRLSDVVVARRPRRRPRAAQPRASSHSSLARRAARLAAPRRASRLDRKASSQKGARPRARAQERLRGARSASAAEAVPRPQARRRRSGRARERGGRRPQAWPRTRARRPATAARPTTCGTARLCTRESTNELARRPVRSTARLIGADNTNTTARNVSVRGYTLLNLNANYEAQKGLDYFVRLNNVLNRRFETYGMMGQSLFDQNGVDQGGTTINRFVAPGAPRSFMIGLRYKY